MMIDVSEIYVSPDLLRALDPGLLDVSDLVPSIKSKGLLQPLVLRTGPNGKELVAGYRRLKAATEAGLKTVPVMVRELNDEQALEVELTENLARKDLPPHREAQGIVRLLAYRTGLDEGATKSFLYQIMNHHKGLTPNAPDPDKQAVVEATFADLGRSLGVFVADKLPTLNWEPDILKGLDGGQIGLSDARVLRKINNPELREKAAQLIATGQYSAEKAKAVVLGEAAEVKSVSHMQTTLEKLDAWAVDEQGYLVGSMPIALPEPTYYSALSREHLVQEIILRQRWAGRRIAMIYPEPDDVLLALQLGCKVLWVDASKLGAHCKVVGYTQLPERVIMFARIGEKRSERFGDPSPTDLTTLPPQDAVTAFSRFPAVVAPLKYGHLFSSPISLVAVASPAEVWLGYLSQPE